MATQSGKFRFLLRSAIVAATLMFCAVLFGAWRTVQHAAEGEKISNSLHLMAKVVAGSIRHNGRWPESADDLQTAPAVELAAFAWPRDRELLLQRVTVDFGLTPQDCQAFTATSFRAVRPVDERFLNPYWQQHLFETIIEALISPTERDETADVR